MLKQYLKLIFRDLFRRKWFSIINILGIALGFTVCILTLFYVYTEHNFDRYISGVENKYRIVWGTSEDVQAILPYVFKEKLKSQLPEKSEVCLVSPLSNQYLSYRTHNYKFENVLFSDIGFRSMFSLSMLQGDTTNLLNAPFQVLLSEEAARKIFGEKDPLNQVLRFWMRDFTVVGVFNDLPSTSSQKADVVISDLSWKEFSPGNLTSWGNKSCDYYLSLPANTNMAELQHTIKELYLSSDPGFDGLPDDFMTQISFALEPVTDIHLKSGHVHWDEDKNKGNLGMVTAFILIGVLILLMAGFNYVNLSSAYFQTKNTLSGIQKVMGASTRNLITYIFTQTFVIVLSGFALSLLFVQLVLSVFNQVVIREMTFSLLFSPAILGILLFLVSFIVVLSGLFPAISFVGGAPVFTLKGGNKPENSGFGFSIRKILVVAQFVISIVLISGIITMSRQIRLMSNQKLGFNAEQLIETEFRINKENFELFRNQLASIPGVVEVAAASNTPGEYINNENPFRLSSESKDRNRDGASVVGITPNYFDLMQITLLEGSRFTLTDEKQNVAVLSQTAVAMLGLLHPVGKRINLSITGKDYLVLGVVEDVQYRSLRESSKPVIYLPDFSNYNNVVIRLRKGNHVETIDKIEKAWHSISPDRPFDFRFFDNKIQSYYAYEISALNLLNVLVVISIIISSLGILGLITEIAFQRTKEIGIRKVNGAKISEILTMLNKDFVKWVAIAFVIATPIAYYAMHKWLENFAYKTTLSWWIFALAGLLALGIALLTVSWQSWRAATRNPVEALRYE